VERLKKAIRQAAGEERAHFFDATRTASALFGDSLGSNMFMLGFAYQQGGLPLSAEAVERAIELNGQAVAMNVAAFRWGRCAAHEPDFVRGLVDQAGQAGRPGMSRTLDEVIERRAEFLAAYQSPTYAQRYRDRIAAVRQAEAAAMPGGTVVTETAARSLFKLMAVKDEYEVARLYTSGAFMARLHERFEGDFRLGFHLAPPLLAKRNAKGELVKREYGPWMFKVFGLLARLRRLRGGALDPFGRSAERRMERRLIADYEADLERLLATLDRERLPLAVRIASLPEEIRGFGHVKERSVKAALVRRGQLLEEYGAVVPAATSA
jgi:indolepyruvate ferredoxin oxidoreductase